VSDDEKRRISFALRLATSLKDRAKLLAARDGISLNHFISQAVAEKIGRLRSGADSSEEGFQQKVSSDLGSRVRCEVTSELTAYSIEHLLTVTVPAGHIVHASLMPVIGEADEIEFTWGNIGDIRFRAPRELFLMSIQSR
jgi:HicB family